MHPLSALDDLDSYRRLFTDVAFWTPYVQEVCAREDFSCRLIRTGVPGTCPVFIVDECRVVKFFGRLFGGGQSFAVEHEAGRLTSLDPGIHVAKMLAVGELLPSRAGDWSWPYLVFEYLPAVSIGEVMEQVALPDRLQAAFELGDTVRRIHALPLAGSQVFPDTVEPYLRFLEEQRAGVVARQQGWGRLPERMVSQIENYLPPPAELAADSSPPHLIHADLTRDHLLGRLENGRWTSLAIIDFGDAMTGSLYYELAAMHLDLFSSDKRLLAAFLDAYQLAPTERAALPRKALATALLHQFNIFTLVPEDLLRLGTLEELARALWEV